MALEAGTLYFTVEFAQGLRDMDWFGKQDPFVVVTVGSQTYRTKTVQGGGKNPVFNETFRFNIINENDFQLVVRDEDVTENELIGFCRGDLARVRTTRADRLQLPVQSSKSKQHGIVSVSLRFEPNSSLAHPAAPAPYANPYPAGHWPQAPIPYAAPSPYQAPPAPVPYGAAPYSSPYQTPPAPWPPAPATYGAPAAYGQYPPAQPGAWPSAPTAPYGAPQAPGGWPPAQYAQYPAAPPAGYQPYPAYR